MTSGRVLDVACGGGWGTAILGGGAEALGVDLSPAAVADARRDHGDRAEFSEADMLDLPFGDEEFEAVVCFEALTHVAEPDLVLDELRRVLRRGGLLLVSCPARGAYPPGNPLQLSELTSAELRERLAARFANVAVYPQETRFASILGDPREARAVSERAGRELYAVGAASDGELPPPPSLVALGEDVDYEAQRRLLREWQERAVRAEAEALALAKELRALRS